MLKRYIINDNTCACTLDPQFDKLSDAHNFLMTVIKCDIDSCCSSNYEIYDTYLNMVVLRYENDNIDRFTVDALKSRIIQLLEVCTLSVREDDEYTHKFILEEVIRLEQIATKKLHPDWL